MREGRKNNDAGMKITMRFDNWQKNAEEDEREERNENGEPKHLARSTLETVGNQIKI